MKKTKYQSIEEMVKKWIKFQHGSAGWERKLINLCKAIHKAAREEEICEEDCPYDSIIT